MYEYLIELVTTPGHPFFIYGKGFEYAGNLRAGDILVNVNGEQVVLEFVQHEILESPVKVYNFEVEDWHTYFVGIDSVWVHNVCGKAPKANLKGGNSSSKFFLNGKAGETELANMFGGKSQAYFKTTNGARYIDQLADGVAHESKVGYTSLTQFVKKQILKDVEILGRGDVDDVVWHFFKSGVTGKGGPSQPLADFLTENGIKYIIH